MLKNQEWLGDQRQAERPAKAPESVDYSLCQQQDCRRESSTHFVCSEFLNRAQVDVVFFWKQKRKGRRGIFPNDRLTSSTEWERDLFWKAKGRSGGGSETSSVSPRNSTRAMLFHCLLACVFKCLSYQQPSARLHFCGCWDLFVVPPFAWTLPFGKFWLCFIFCCSGNFTLCEKIKSAERKKKSSNG